MYVTQKRIVFRNSTLLDALCSFYTAVKQIRSVEKQLGDIEVEEDPTGVTRWHSVSLTGIWLEQIKTRLVRGTAEHRSESYHFTGYPDELQRNHGELCKQLSGAKKTQEQAEAVEEFAVKVMQAKAALKHFLRIWNQDDQQSDNESKLSGESSASHQSTDNPPTSEAPTGYTRD